MEQERRRLRLLLAVRAFEEGGAARASAFTLLDEKSDAEALAQLDADVRSLVDAGLLRQEHRESGTWTAHLTPKGEELVFAHTASLWLAPVVASIATAPPAAAQDARGPREWTRTGP
ncbi:hypothetical protein HQQ82_10300 [Rathayibacter sp. VKM Ac-2856]|uniref:hypothetical protein n=1 Tax=unclassified Rathayibacter TaxID=2609250 RepID=UPI00156587DB|nr:MULTISPECIES: hypothetical protein [unclassified Rathayibacter]NQX05192.1 hypothetical protein [Rathayibacter sp. VKM Ac-2858]NQX20359.1 hypothetical protein [Rathayibacter sp. VKM Ac-2856]